jgi:hypothetical protein
MAMLVTAYGDKDGKRAAFEQALTTQCKELSIDLVLSPAAGRRDPPAVAVVFPINGDAWSAADTQHCAGFASVDHPVLPVIGCADDARGLPPALARFNAFQTDPWHRSWAVGLIDEVLSYGWLQRRERRVFISYKRTDSGPIAQQLYAALTRLGYVTFLDDVSIDKGLDFQRELKWWLNDADVVLVFVTPNFENSKWCMEEINFARANAIGLLGVEWPGSVFGAVPARAFPRSAPAPAGLQSPAPVIDNIDADQRLQLTESDFMGTAADPLWEQELTAAGLDRIVTHCARQRAMAIRLRLENLIPQAARILKPPGPLQSAYSPGDFTFTDAAGEQHFVRVLPFRPDARALHAAFQEAGARSHVGCLYGESDPTDPRAEALRWLATGRRGNGANAHQMRVWACQGERTLP